jgi:hypothetical protein
MNAFADLEFTFHRRDEGVYTVDLRFSQPDSETDIRLANNGHVQAQIDLERLREHALDLEGYGRTLTEGVFADEQLRTAFSQALATAQSSNTPLRLRLFVGPSAPELHTVRWETLRDPQQQTVLAASERILFSRYLSSGDWRPIHLRPKGDLRALVVIANPTDVGNFAPGGVQLTPVDVDGELQRAQQNLTGISVTALFGGSASFQQIVTSLRDGYDVLYLVAHGALIRGKPMLWLEGDQGAAAVTAGSDLASAIRELDNRPRLVVLASCQSAGSGDTTSTGDNGALAALGPQLAEAGIPAVLAMQGSVLMSTIAKFMPVFFTELVRDGQIDRAMAAARAAAKGQPDAWMPVLFMRLKTGRIWYVPGFGMEGGGFEKWPALINSINAGRCTPVIGPGITDSLLGSSREIAQRWAEQYRFPLAGHERDDLPQVAQYLSVNQDLQFPRDALNNHLIATIKERYASVLPDNLGNLKLDELLTTISSKRREQGQFDPHTLLGSLPCPIFVTTSPTSLLADALTAAGKRPVREICKWNADLELLPSIRDSEPDYRPSPERPLVFHLFGHLSEPDSLVLTEDDYFHFLIGVTSNKDLILPVVRRALADTALLFVGFQLDDWNFRVLFRSIMSQEGGVRRKRYAHIGVNVNPEEGRIAEPDRARQYLTSYFQSSDISLFWGSTDDFVRELQQRTSGKTV